ncbi:MAG TPA: MFS transporter [Rhizomicrobium sp.]|jgi:ACS family tartrate transporter-like MFS transporter|nr:MFS transporter [Rhizomicrobium sp.]
MNQADQVFAKCAWRLVPLITLLYFVNIMDRVNVGFAALTMNHDLGFSPAVFGFGSSAFFLGYALFQVPANAVLERIGAKRWIFLLLLLWGVLSTSNGFVTGAHSFYAVRVALGVVEAGFYPGMILYLTYWFTRPYRGRLVAIFMAAVPAASIVGGPLSSLILGMNGYHGLAGWQWLFVIEGAPAILLAVAVLLFLPDGPKRAAWLNQEEKSLIARELSAEDTSQHRDFWAALTDIKVLGLGVVYFGYSAGLYGVGLWLPQIVKGMGVSNLANGFVVALPYIAGAIAMIWWGRHSDRTGERIWHVAGPGMLMLVSLLAASLSHSNLVIFLALSLVQIGALSLQGPFWVLPSTFLGGAAAASGIALINSIGTGGGGFVGPNVLGLMRELTGGFAAGMAVLAIGPILTVTIVLILGRAGSRLVAAKTG